MLCHNYRIVTEHQAATVKSTVSEEKVADTSSVSVTEAWMRIPPQDEPSYHHHLHLALCPPPEGGKQYTVWVYYSPFVTVLTPRYASHFLTCGHFVHLVSLWKEVYQLAALFSLFNGLEKQTYAHTLPLEDKMKQSFCYPICFPSHHSGSGKRQRGIIYAFVDLWSVLIHNAVIFKGKSSKHHRPGLDGQYVVQLYKLIHAAQIIIFCINVVSQDPPQCPWFVTCYSIKLKKKKKQ